MKPIITSTEDNDSYVSNMGVIARKYPHVRVRYEYINRDPNHRFQNGFEQALEEQIGHMTTLRMTDAEYAFQRQSQPWICDSYSQWKRDTFRYQRNHIDFDVTDGRLRLQIEGDWASAMPWETPLLAVISRLALTTMINGQEVEFDPEWRQWLKNDFDQMYQGDVQVIDFGARRRADIETEDYVCELGKKYPNFRGTSNPYLAQKHGLKVFGTNAHQYTQFMMAKYGPIMCNRMAMEEWSQTFRGSLGVALTDLVTTPVFLRDFDPYYAKLFDGVRQDSGDPSEIADMVIAHYEKLGIDPRTKVIVFSDSLDPSKACLLTKKYGDRIKVSCGIGTRLTHNVGKGLKAMNHVIKATAFDLGNGWIPVVKLSDSPGKHTGDPVEIAVTKHMLRIQRLANAA